MYASIQPAVTAINAASPAPSTTNRVVIPVHPGKYTTSSAITVPSYVGIKGVSKGLVSSRTTPPTCLSAPETTGLKIFLIEGGTTSSVYAFDGNNKDKLHFRRVDMLNNGGTPVQSSSTSRQPTWKVLFIEDCIIDYYRPAGTPSCAQQRRGCRFCDTIINNVLSTRTN